MTIGEARLFVFPAKRKITKSVYALISKQDAKEALDICCESWIDPKLLKTHKAKVRQTHKRINCLVLELPRRSLKSLSQKLRKEGHRTALTKPVYPLLHESIPLMEVPEAWNKGLTGKGILIGVIDSGIDAAHPDFSSRVKSYRDFTSTGLKDRVGHGTHVAGIIAGNGAFYRGVAPEAELLVAKVLDREGTTDDVVLAGISWAAYSGAQVINLSLGGPGDPDDVLSQECDALMKDGILVCVAAGNSGPDHATINSPGTSRLTITVGAVDKEKSLTMYSSRGPVRDPKTGKNMTKPDLLACGGGYAQARGCDYRAGIVSAKSSATKSGECSVSAPLSLEGRGQGEGELITNHKRSFYEKMSGTSMAAPHVTGICGLLLQSLSNPRYEIPNLKSKENLALHIKNLLLRSCQYLRLPRNFQGSGFLSAKLASSLLIRKTKHKKTQRNHTVLVGESL